MPGDRHFQISREGVPFLIVVLAGIVAFWHYFGLLYALPLLPVLVLLYLFFRDPDRAVPAVPLGVVSPVDGEVISVVAGRAAENGEGARAHRVTIRVSLLGTYTARSPVEGKIMDLAADGTSLGDDLHASGLWVQTDEGQNVVLQFRGHWLGLAPLAFARYGERIGQGQRFAYLRLARLAEVRMPGASRLLVTEGQPVAAGHDQLGKLPHT